MRRIATWLVAVVVVAFAAITFVAPSALATVLSGGCTAANAAHFDNTYTSGQIPDDFTDGERLAITVDGPSNATATLSVDGTVVVGPLALPAALNYTFQGTGMFTARWEVHGVNEAAWTVSCGVGLTQTITFPQPAPVTYGVAPFTLGATASSGLPIEYLVSYGTCTVEGATLTVHSAGDCVIDAFQPGNAVYDPTNGIGLSLTVNPAALTVAAPSPTTAYGQVPSLSPAITGFVYSDNATSTGLAGQINCASTATATSPPGTYPVTCGGPNAITNYTVAYTAGTLTVVKAPTTTAVSISPSTVTAYFPAVLTANVSHAGSGLPPTGTVSFYLDGAATPTATVTLSNAGTASVAETLAPGQHSLVAKYSGDGNYTASQSSGQGISVVPCDTVVTGSTGAVAVSRSGTTCVVNAQVNGGIVAPPGATLAIVGSTVHGSITVSKPTQLRICGSAVQTIAVSGATGHVTIGDPSNSCPANAINGSVLATSNSGGGTVSGNTITGAITVSGNSPPFAVTGNH